MGDGIVHIVDAASLIATGIVVPSIVFVVRSLWMMDRRLLRMETMIEAFIRPRTHRRENDPEGFYHNGD